MKALVEIVLIWGVVLALILAAFLLNFWLIHRIDILVGVNATRAIGWCSDGNHLDFWARRYKMMTLAEAMQARNIRLCDLSRQSGVSRPTLDGILGKKKVFNKAGVRTETL